MTRSKSRARTDAVRVPGGTRSCRECEQQGPGASLRHLAPTFVERGGNRRTGRSRRRACGPSVVKNAGARFSDQGYGKLVGRAAGDETHGREPRASQRHAAPPFPQASADCLSPVCEKLAAAHPRMSRVVNAAVAEIANEISEKMRDASPRSAGKAGNQAPLHHPTAERDRRAQGGDGREVREGRRRAGPARAMSRSSSSNARSSTRAPTSS